MIFTEPLSFVCSGDFASAVAALGDRWPGVGIEPERNGESDKDYARLLMTCAVLTLNIGAMDLRPTQARAKDMLSKAERLFGDDPGEQQAQLWLGVAYLRCGENYEAIALMDSVLARQSANVEVTFGASLTKAIAHLALEDVAAVETDLASVEMLLPAVPVLTQGKFYLNRGMMFRQKEDYESALADYSRAAVLCREAGSERYEAAVENNQARIYMLQGRLLDAESSAKRALILFQQIQDKAHEAKALDELARIYERLERYELMEDHARRAVSLLSESDHEGWFAEALVTHGIACVLLSQHRFLSSLAIADRQNDRSQVDAVTKAMWETVGRAKDVERLVYERVLAKHGGRISPTAHELGFCGHQKLQKRLENHFPELLTQRRPKRRRHKSIFKR